MKRIQLETKDILKRIAQASNGNLRVSLLMLESMALNNELALKSSSPIIKPDWIIVIHKLTRKIVKERSVNSLIECRAVLYDLLAHCIPANIILKELTFSLLDVETLNTTNKSSIIEYSSVFDERLSLGNKAIFHLEGFIAKVMCCLD